MHMTEVCAHTCPTFTAAYSNVFPGRYVSPFHLGGSYTDTPLLKTRHSIAVDTCYHPRSSIPNILV